MKIIKYLNIENRRPIKLWQFLGYTLWLFMSAITIGMCLMLIIRK